MDDDRKNAAEEIKPLLNQFWEYCLIRYIKIIIIIYFPYTYNEINE